MTSKDTSNQGRQDGGSEAPPKTVRIDSRVVYLVLGSVGLLAVLAVAVALGRGVGDSTAAAGDAEAPQQPRTYSGVSGLVDPNLPAPAPRQTQAPGGGGDAPGGVIDLEGVPTSEYDLQPMIRQVVRGVPPVSLEDVPVAAGEPRIWIDGLEETGWVMDLGEVPADGPTTRDLTVRNLGRAELVIDRIGGSCGCTGLSLGDANVAPGGETTIRVSYDPRVSEDFGKDVKKQVYISSNDPQAAVVEFYFSAKVQEQGASGSVESDGGASEDGDEDRDSNETDDGSGDESNS